MVHLPLRGSDSYDIFFPLHLEGCLLLSETLVLIQLLIFILSCKDWLRHLLLRWCGPPFRLEHCLNKDLAINYITL
jgi:hypothetical protein